MQNLQTLISQLEKGRNIHISILDLGGVLNYAVTAIDFKHVMHTKRFCDIAKSTERGYRSCLRCKMLANTKAIEGKVAFRGSCVYGLYEAAVPLIIKKNVMAVVYVGNAVVDEAETKARIDKTCALTGVSSERLYNQLGSCEYINNESELYEIAEIVCDYMKMLYLNAPRAKNELHWFVHQMKRYADESFCYNISLRELAVTYHKNEKYIGRLFKSEVGMSYSEYCTDLRLRKAEVLLSQSDEKIIDIALECGFNGVSYFNRVFFKKYGMSPGQYRIKYAAEKNR